jgi:hypothetical protein
VFGLALKSLGDLQPPGRRGAVPWHKQRLVDVAAALPDKSMERDRAVSGAPRFLDPSCCDATTKASGQKWKSRLNVWRWPALRSNYGCAGKI